MTLARPPCLTHLDCAGSLLRPSAEAAAAAGGGGVPAEPVFPSSLTKEMSPWPEGGLGSPRGHSRVSQVS